MRLILFIISFVVAFLLSSCEFHASDNGDLDGNWYLVTVDTLKNGASVDYREKQVFWGVQGSILQFLAARSMDTYLCSFHDGGDKLVLYSMYKYNRYDGDEPITPDRMDEMNVYGINAEQELFHIEQCDGDDLVLRNNILRLHFIRY